MDIILATHNPSKALQIKAMLEDLPIRVRTLAEAGITEEAEEDGDSIEENVLKKIQHARKLVGNDSAIIAEDTGLYIEALGGKPGHLAARWAGKGKTELETMRYALDQMKHLAPMSRMATFKTIAFVSLQDLRGSLSIGSLRGIILTEPRCACQPKMPYGPIFMPRGKSKVLGEMTVEEENRISHRGEAFRKVREYLEGILAPA